MYVTNNVNDPCVKSDKLFCVYSSVVAVSVLPFHPPVLKPLVCDPAQAFPSTEEFRSLLTVQLVPSNSSVLDNCAADVS